VQTSNPALRTLGMETPPLAEPVHGPRPHEARVLTRAASRTVCQVILLIGAILVSLAFASLLVLFGLIPPPFGEIVVSLASFVFLAAGPLAAFLTVLAIGNLVQSGYEGFIWTLVAAIPLGVVISLVSAFLWLLIL
jgi:hypothetical protein